MTLPFSTCEGNLLFGRLVDKNRNEMEHVHLLRGDLSPACGCKYFTSTLAYGVGPKDVTCGGCKMRMRKMAWVKGPRVVEPMTEGSTPYSVGQSRPPVGAMVVRYGSVTVAEWRNGRREKTSTLTRNLDLGYEGRDGREGRQ